MKKSLLFITSFCISILNVGAQIIITTADMPVSTDTIYQANDTLPTISIGAPGINQTWNMTSLVIHTMDTSMVLPYSTAPNPEFSTANLVIAQQGPQDFYGYVLNTASDMILLGGAGVVDIGGNPIQINQISTPAEILFNFPTAYNSTYTQNYSTSAKFYFGQTIQGITIDSIHQKSGIKKTFLVDAWGTLTTPLAGGPYNVLRTKEVKVTHDTTQAFFFGSWNDIPGGISADSTATYNWWANGIHAALATATMDSTGFVNNVQWLMAIPPAIPPLSLTVSSSNLSCSGLCDGTATVMAYWGSGPKTYAWSTSPVQNSITAIGLCAGTYTVTITDSLLATATATVTISNPPQPVISANGTALSTNIMGIGFQWYLNGAPISNATSSSYTVTQNGNYTVSVSSGSCTDTSSVYNFNTIGINESDLNNSLTIFPNPANNQITIKFDTFSMNSSKNDVFMDIKNELGQSIKKTSVKQIINGKNEMIMDIADLPCGIYFIEIKNQNKSVNKKFIKQ